MMAIVPGVIMTTFVMQFTLLAEDPSRTDATSLVLAENMARYHAGAFQLAEEAQRTGSLSAGTISYTLDYPFQTLAGWHSEVADDGTNVWLFTWPSDNGTYSAADMSGVIDVLEDQQYRAGEAGIASANQLEVWQAPLTYTPIPDGVPVIATPMRAHP
jgi:hypothetical protein